MKVELVYEKTCPNIEAARNQLLQAFTDLQLTPHWYEWEVSSADTPDYAHGYGSPTLLVNGKDVSGNLPNGHDYSCRIYCGDDVSHNGIPSLTDIKTALRSATHEISSNALCVSFKT